MEKTFKIPTRDWYEISSILNSKGDQSKKLIIFVHGLTGSMNESHWYMAKEYFTEKWYDVLRFALYAGGEKSRQLHECSIWEHNIDVETILEYFSSLYEEISLVGHSLGCPSIAWVKYFPNNLKNIVFWDPAFDTSDTVKRCFEKNWLWFFYPKNGKNVEITYDLYVQLKQNDHFETLKNSSIKKQLIKVIYAGEALHKTMKEKIESLGIQCAVIDGANHWFTQEGKFGELFEKTLQYIEK
jgi:pimeloyl-ACP methyl ester carboxylesterase